MKLPPGCPPMASKRRPRVLPNGRNRSERFIKLEHYMFNSEAFRSLHPYSRALWFEMRAIYNGSNNGRLGMSVRHAMKRLNIGQRAVERAFDELQDRGFIVAATKGSFNLKSRHATEWRLTDEEADGRPATKEFMRWRKGGQKQNPVAATHTDGSASEYRDLPEDAALRLDGSADEYCEPF